MSQIQSAEVFTDVSPGNQVTSTRMNTMINGGVLLNGAVLDQLEKTLPVAADTVLLGDSTQPNSAVPKKVQIGNLLLDTQRNGTQQYAATDTGSAANVYVVTVPYTTTILQAGMVLRFKPAHTNTGASTVAVTSNAVLLGTPTIKTRAGADLLANDLLAGAVVELVFDGTFFQLQSASSAVTAGLYSGAAQYSADTGTANSYVATLSPVAALANGLTVRFKATNTNTGASVLNTNATGAIAIKKVTGAGIVALAANDILTGDVVTAVYDGTQYIMESRVRGWDFVDTAQALPGSSNVLTRPHGLGFVPTKVRAVLVNVTGNQGYTTGQQLEIAGASGTAGFQVSSDATNIYVAQTNSNTPSIIPAAGGGASAITAADWNILIYASL